MDILPNQNNITWEIIVCEPERVGPILYQHVSYNIHIKSSSKHPKFKKTEYNLIRRYSDFEWLRNKLSENFRGYIIPPLPEKDFVKRFMDELITYRVNLLQKFLVQVFQTEAFLGSNDLHHFIESDKNEFIPTIDPNKSDKKGFFQSLSKKLANLHVSIGNFEEVDEWFTNQKQHLQIMEDHYNKLVEQSININKKEKEISQLHSDISEIAFSIKRIEKNYDDKLSMLFSNLSDATTNITKGDKEMFDTHAKYFNDSFKFITRYYESIKESLYQRDKDLFLYQDSTNSNYQSQEKLKVKPSDQKLLEDCVRKEKLVMTTKNQFENISKVLKEELMEFEKIKNKEITTSFKNLAKKRIEYHKNSAEIWKSILKETLEVD